MIKISDEDQEQNKPPATAQSTDFEEEAIYTLDPPPGPRPKEILQPLDVTPFLRYCSVEMFCELFRVKLLKIKYCKYR